MEDGKVEFNVGAGGVARVAHAGRQLWGVAATDRFPRPPGRYHVQDRVRARALPRAEGPVRAVIVQVDGERVLENYYDSSRNEYRDIYSVTKSVMSTLVGIAIDEGLIAGVESTLAELLPSYAATMEQPVADTTLDEVLTMSAGFPGGGLEDCMFETSADPVRAILNNAVRAPGEESGTTPTRPPSWFRRFSRPQPGSPRWSTRRPGCSNPWGSRAVRRRVWSCPEGSTPTTTPTSPGRSTMRAWRWAGRGPRLRPVDLVSLGQLFLQRGLWEGTQIVSEAWADQAVRDQVPELNVSPAPNSYGYSLVDDTARWRAGLRRDRLWRATDRGRARERPRGGHLDPRQRGHPEDFGITDTHAEQIVDAITGAL